MEEHWKDTMTAKAHPSINKTARLAGALYLGMAVLAFIGILYVPSALIVPGDATATAGNIAASEGLFRIGILSHLIGQALFIFLVLALYKLFEPVHKRRAVLMVVLALLGVPIAFLIEANHFAVLLLVSEADYLAAFDSDQLNAQLMFFLDVRSQGILLAQVFWGLWLLPLGLLVYKSNFIPKILGVLLIIGGLGYLIDVSTLVLFPDTGVTISQFTFVGELLLLLWLLFRGVNVEQWNLVAHDHARPAKPARTGPEGS